MHGAALDDAEKRRDEAGADVGAQRDAMAAADPDRLQSAGKRIRHRLQFRIAVRAIAETHRDRVRATQCRRIEIGGDIAHAGHDVIAHETRSGGAAPERTRRKPGCRLNPTPVRRALDGAQGSARNLAGGR